MVQFPIVLLVIITETPPSLKLLLLVTSLLFLNQLIAGCGFPVAVQVKLALSSFNTTTVSAGWLTTGITEANKQTTN